MLTCEEAVELDTPVFWSSTFKVIPLETYRFTVACAVKARQRMRNSEVNIPNGFD
jgi:hypothetical protein